MRKYIYLLLLFFITLVSTKTYATHIRAGDITAKVVNFKTRTYIFTLTLYRDITGVDQLKAELNFGDGTGCTSADLASRVNVGNETEKLTYHFTHSFLGDDTYTISFNEENRNANINNVADGNSVNISFYVETELVIDAFNGENSTPVLLIPPIDKAVSDEIYIHNPGAFDPDGDSLAYVLTVSKAYNEGEDGCGTGDAYTVPNYKLPNHPNFDGLNVGGGPATFTLDPIKGDLIWNTPGKEGEYNMAFVVEEWRKINGEWVRLGFVTRDMQVTVEDSDNKPPIVIVPKDTCIVAGTVLNGTIKVDDTPNSTTGKKDKVFISSYSGIYSLADSSATFSGAKNKESKISKDVPYNETFSWKTNCSHVRQNPYQVIFVAKDDPGATKVPLVALEIWNITVVAPAPKLTTVEPGTGKKINLTWQSYKPSTEPRGVCDNAEKILIYRKKGPYNFTPTNCQIGIPEGAGYELVGTVNAEVTTFTDEKNLEKGVQYCYRLVAQFRAPEGGLSYASEEMCTVLKIDVPVITKVSVDSTSIDKGVIEVNWLPPLELDVATYNQPYKYELYRSEGMTNGAPTLVYSTNDFTANKFIDKGLNTERNPYTYQILFYYEGNKLLDSSAAASSVRLAASGGVSTIDLTWTYETPWINTNFVIYRQKEGTNDFEEIGTTPDLSFVDDGKLGLELIPEKEYCYRIEAFGTYNNPLIPSPLRNFSQIVCQSPKDSIPPCPPVLAISPKNCEEFKVNPTCGTDTYFNTLTWTDVTGPECKNDIDFYNVYYAFSSDPEKLALLATDIKPNTFLHKNNPFFYAGCYVVTAVDKSGNESAPSNMVCNDNCPYINFPNAFTPNSDGINEEFKANEVYPECARFVESIELIIVNRWGNVIYDTKATSTNPEEVRSINWDGKASNGTEAPTGTYFYTAKVKFITLDPNKTTQTFKGWIQLLK